MNLLCFEVHLWLFFYFGFGYKMRGFVVIVDSSSYMNALRG